MYMWLALRSHSTSAMSPLCKLGAALEQIDTYRRPHSPPTHSLSTLCNARHYEITVILLRAKEPKQVHSHIIVHGATAIPLRVVRVMKRCGSLIRSPALMYGLHLQA